MEIWPEVIGMEGPPFPDRGKVAVCSLKASAALPSHFHCPHLPMKDTERLTASLLRLFGLFQPIICYIIWCLVRFSSPADGSMGTCSPPSHLFQKTGGRCLSSAPPAPLTFTGWSNGTVVPLQVGGGDRVEGVERETVRAVHGAGQAVLKVQQVLRFVVIWHVRGQIQVRSVLQR